jgi:hypothetical protein
MKFSKTKDREEAYRNAINMWLKCAPLFGEPKNIDVCTAVIEQNKARRYEINNSFGESDEGAMRIGISLPPGLYYTLSKLEKFHGREFMKDKEDLRWFARKFPQFCIWERI